MQTRKYFIEELGRMGIGQIENAPHTNRPTYRRGNLYVRISCENCGIEITVINNTPGEFATNRFANYSDAWRFISEVIK